MWRYDAYGIFLQGYIDIREDVWYDMGMVNYSIEMAAASAKNRIAPARHAGYNQRRKYMVLERKELKDLDLLDRFLFAEAIEDPETMELILEIILGRDIVLKHLPQAEKEQRSFL